MCAWGQGRGITTAPHALTRAILLMHAIHLPVPKSGTITHPYEKKGKNNNANTNNSNPGMRKGPAASSQLQTLQSVCLGSHSTRSRGARHPLGRGSWNSREPGLPPTSSRLAAGFDPAACPRRKGRRCPPAKGRGQGGCPGTAAGEGSGPTRSWGRGGTAGPSSSLRAAVAGAGGQAAEAPGQDPYLAAVRAAAPAPRRGGEALLPGRGGALRLRAPPAAHKALASSPPAGFRLSNSVGGRFARPWRRI